MRATSTSILTASSSDLFSVRFTGVGPFTITDQNITFLDSFIIGSGTVSMASGTTAVGGSFVATGGAFTHATGTLLLNGSTGGLSFNPGVSPLAAVQISAPGGSYTAESATTTGNFSLLSATGYTQSSSTRLSVGGVFTNLVGGAPTTWTGSSLVLGSGWRYSINTKVAGGDSYGALTILGNSDLRLWNSNATSINVASTSSLYSQDHSAVDGSLFIYGDFEIASSTEYWSYAADFDGASLGGGSRPVTVYHANGATTTISGSGALSMIGAVGNVTRVEGLGGGTYSFIARGGTLSAQHYRFTNLDEFGMRLLGSAIVSELSDGFFELTVDGGTLITLASSTLNSNPSKIWTTVGFAATSSLSGVNVALVGTSSSVWRFSGSYGALGGEGFDSDGLDACGSIRWDNSSCLLTEQTNIRWRNDDGGEGAPASEWFDSAWDYRQSVRILNADAVSYASTAVKITVPYDSAMQSDFRDLRFTAGDGTTLIPHWIERVVPSTEAIIWARVPLLATSTHSRIFMYFGNAGASSTSDGSQTFSVFDDYEDNSLSEYSGDTSLFTTATTPIYAGTYSLIAANPSGKTTDGIFRFDQTVSRGQSIRYLQYVDTGAGSGDEPCALFGVQSPGTTNQNYAVCLEQFGTDRISLARNVDSNDTSGTVLATTSVTYSTGWYEVEIDWRPTNVIMVSLYTSAGTLVATTSATDSTYSSGGFGYAFWFQNGAWDSFTARPRVATRPTVFLGARQTDGGATWIAPQNAPGNALPGDRVRLRVAIENSGLTITNQLFRLDYAPKGSSPTCDAVSSAAYAAVPPAASCGSSPICMATSSEVANDTNTTDHLLDVNGTFAAGKIVTSPANQTTALTLNQNRYTELEYVLTPTVNASDSYCFRVTNAGAPLDFYTEVAELGLSFAPQITALSLNAGADITLSPGTTTVIVATGTVTDLNGFTDLGPATTTIFRSGVTSACAADANTCYIATPSACSYSGCSGTTCTISCAVDMAFHADPTDIGVFAGETWRAELTVSDLGGFTASATAPSIDLLTLRALSVDTVIDFGALEVNSDTGSNNATTSIQNIGNDSIDVALDGTNLTDGLSSTIPVSQQRYATSSFTYSSCLICRSLATTTDTIEVDLPKPTSVDPAIVDDLFWGIAIPFGVAARPHQGINIFYAVGD
jgi:hypothetical protein